MAQAPVYFYYLAEPEQPLPKTLADFRDRQRALGRTQALLGPASWTIQTCLQLQHRGFRCDLVSEVPESGIVLSRRAHIPDRVAQSRLHFWVCMLADRPYPHPHVQFHVLQNPRQRLRFCQPFAYLPHWPQSGPVPRDPARGLTIRNVRFFGEWYSLAPALQAPEFSGWCAANGYNFSGMSRDRWHDFSECDIAIAIRSLGSASWHHDKPATKLFNAWLANVPVIAGQESAFRTEGRRGLNYLEAGNLGDVQQSLLRLRWSTDTYLALVEAGRQAAAGVTFDAIAQKWATLLGQTIIPAATSWRSTTPLSALADRWASRLREGLAWRGHLLETDEDAL